MLNKEQFVGKLTLRNFWNNNKHLAIPFDWLRGRRYSEAFVICLGAGPWKFERRKNIQKAALEKLKTLDLSNLSLKNTEDFYPLKWQNQFLYNAVDTIKKRNITFDSYCQKLIDEEPEFALLQMKRLVRTPNAKVISLFCRDALKVPSFPIDRHVRRKLIELNLPTKELNIMRLCYILNLNPREVAVAFVRAASDMDNPDWSINH